MKNIQGFTLIEAIVAMVIFTAAAMGIYSWINTSLISLQKIETVAISEQVVQTALEELKQVDLSKNEQGNWTINQFQVSWSSRLLEPWVAGVTSLGETGLYDFALFEVTFIITERGLPRGQYIVRHTSAVKARELEYE